MTARVLLTGGGGFVGRRLATELRARHPEWSIDTPDRMPSADEPDGLDVTDAEAVDAWIARRRPDAVIHLAAIAAVTSATQDPQQAWKVNLGGTLNVVLALQAIAPDARLMLVSSAEVYGRSLDSGEPATEATLLRPVNPYAASKAAADILVRQAGEGGLATCVMRAFNHTGRGQSESFVTPSFAAQIARIEAGLQAPVLEVGGLDDERDFLDVQDVVDAYADVLDAGERFSAGEVFNVASGLPVRIGDMLEHLLGLSTAKIRISQVPARMRRTSVHRIVGDATHLRASTGWAPTTPLATTWADLLSYERARVTQAAAVAP